MKKGLFVATACALLLSTAFISAEEAKKEAKLDLKGIKCPVSNKPVALAHTAAYKESKVYFCCDNCPKAFAKKTKSYATRANYQLVQTKQAKQVKCPIKGTACKKDISIKVGGLDVYFCCGGCRKSVSKFSKLSPVSKRLGEVFNEKSFKKGYEVAGLKKKAEADKKKKAEASK